MLWGRLYMLEFVLQSYFGIGPSQGSYYAVFTSSSTTQQYAFLVAEAYLPGKLQKVSYHIKKIYQMCRSALLRILQMFCV